MSATGEMTFAEILESLSDVERKVIEEKLAATRKSSGNGTLSFKVGKKGGIAMYGVNSRFPVTLYCNQWIRVAHFLADRLGAFLESSPTRTFPIGTGQKEVTQEAANEGVEAGYMVISDDLDEVTVSLQTRN